MKIQVISYDKQIKLKSNCDEYTFSSLNAPMALDMFDLNIISLQTPDLWTSGDLNAKSLDSARDFQSLKTLLSTVEKSKVIVCFPQNYIYHYYRLSGQYQKQCQLKDMIPSLTEHLNFLLPLGVTTTLVYENSITICEGVRYDAAFYFRNRFEQKNAITKCVGGEHTTTLYAGSHLIFTSLNLSKPNSDINPFLKSIGLLEKKSELPLWVSDLEFWDDKEQREVVEIACEEIEKQKQKINDAQKKLELNLHYKSILYETGDALAKVVFEILEKLLDCNLSDFLDEKKEDFRIVLEEVTFIGEIKGITSNVKLENISQLEVHCNTYMDELEENGRSELVKGILIINPLRTRPLNERERAHERQVQLATKYGSLIITSEILLQLFEKYLQKRITTDKIIELLKNKTGLLSVSDFI